MNTTEVLKSLDPADAGAGPHTPRAQADLRRILGSPRPAPLRKTRKTRPRLVLAGGLVAAAAAGVFVLPSMIGGDQAFASWTARPNGMPAGERADAASACRKHQTSGNPQYRNQLKTATTAIAERRGNWTLVSLAGPDGFSALCITDDSRPIFRSMIGSLGTTAPGARPGRRGLTPIELGTGLIDNRSLSIAAGLAGSDVTAVSYLSPSHGRVTATVSSGQFALWLPGNDLEAANRAGVPFQVSYRDGTTATVVLQL